MLNPPRFLLTVAVGLLAVAASADRSSAQQIGQTKWFGWGIIHDGNYYTLEESPEAGDCTLFTGNCPGSSITKTEEFTVTWTAEAKLGGKFFAEAGMGGSRTDTKTESVTYKSEWYHSECKNCPETAVADLEPEDSPTDPDFGQCMKDDRCLEHEYRFEWAKGECSFGEIGEQAGCGGAAKEEHGACVLPAIFIFQVQPYEQWVFRRHEYRETHYGPDWVPMDGGCRSYVVEKGVRTVGEPSIQFKHVKYSGYKEGLVVLPGCWCDGRGDSPRNPVDEPSPPGDDPTPPDSTPGIE